MASSYRASKAWLGLLLLLAYTHLARATATLFIDDTNTTVAVHFPPDSDDVNLYVSSPDWFQYTAVGFGDSMAPGTFMLVMYASDVRGEVTVSPRISTKAHTEPIYDDTHRLTIHPPSSIAEHLMLVNLTCHACRPYLSSSANPSLIFANGPGVALSSSAPDAFIRRHVAHGRFTIDAARATSPSGLTLKTAADGRAVTDGAVLIGGRPTNTGSSKAAIAHGVVLVVVALAVMPIDAMVAGTLGRRWPRLHAVTGTLVVVLVVVGLAVGVIVSDEHRMTATQQTPHQVLGLIVTGMIFALYLLGIGLAVIKKRFSSAAPAVAADGTTAPQRQQGTGLLGAIHRWTGRLVWVLMVVVGGLGLQLADRGRLFMMGYGVLVGAVFLVLMPVWFCIWRCSKYRKEKAEEEEYELQQQQQYNIYNHDRS